MNSAVFPIFNAYLSHICSGNKNKRIYKHVYTIQEICMHIVYMVRHIGIVLKSVLVVSWLKGIGYVWLMRIGSALVKAYW